MKKLLEKLFEDLIKGSTAYKERDKEANIYERECVKKESRIRHLKEENKIALEEKDEFILEGNKILEEQVITIESLKSKLEEKEKQRRKIAGSIGGLKKQISYLKEENEKLINANTFLKTNRRAPNLEEIKDYTYRRKRKGD